MNQSGNEYSFTSALSCAINSLALVIRFPAQAPHSIRATAEAARFGILCEIKAIIVGFKWIYCSTSLIYSLIAFQEF
ncbi:hypothetical protein N7478_003056 [Penicillium angulare]|uniref:uncharacterized protein n=1 Tax=Penicillium angulare TaxID=116970 RepID=UPI002541BFFB|nr:uncharacterized protein N7478_003056 [Penicillium angulare]KAJ5287370.1 hypothetical protein N7478_003056 [Penicillium angulare]